MQITTSNDRSTLTNLAVNLNAGESKVIFDDQYSGMKESNDNKNHKKVVKLDKTEVAYRSEM